MHQTALSTFVISWMLLVMESNTQPVFSSCWGDMIFVMDASTSIWEVDYSRQLEFVVNLVDTFDIGPGPKQVGISAITFSHRAHLEFPLDKYQTLTELKDAIRMIPYRTGGTNTAAALGLLRQVMTPYAGLNRRPMIAVIITDGLSNEPTLTKREAAKLHRLGVNIHAIGVGYRYDMDELRAIASDPINGVHEVTSYSQLNSIADKFRTRLCKVTIRTTTTTTAATTTTNIEPTIVSRITMTPEMAENSHSMKTIPIFDKTFKTTKAPVLETNRESPMNGYRISKETIPSKSELGEDKSIHRENIAGNPSETIGSNAQKETPREATPISSTTEPLNGVFTTTRANTLITDGESLAKTSIPSNSQHGEIVSNLPQTTAGGASTTINPKFLIATTRKQMVKNSRIQDTPETSKRVTPTGTIDAPRMKMTMKPSNSEHGINEQVPPDARAESSHSISSKITMATTKKGMPENIPKLNTPEIISRYFTTTGANTITPVRETFAKNTRTTTVTKPFRYGQGQNDSIPPKHIAVANGTGIPQNDYASTVVFGFDLNSMGPSRSNSILAFINSVLPHIGYGKFAIISNTVCTHDFNIPLTPARAQDITQDIKISLLRTLNQRKPPVLVDIIRQMNKELFKGEYFKQGEEPYRQIGVLFVDPSVSDINSEVLLEADEMKKNGFELFVISIGSVVWTDIVVFESLSSQPHNDFLLPVSTHERLPDMAKYLPLQFKEIRH